jgi:hypothetical protein
MSTIDWPTGRLTPIARARALAAGLPGAGYAETTIDRPFAEAWPLLMDLERSVPAADRLVRSIRVRERVILPDGAERLQMTSRSSLGPRQDFDVRIEQGFCLMQESRRLFVVVMAAEPHPEHPGATRYVHVEAVPRRLARPLGRVFDRIVADDARGFRHHLEG